MKIGLAYAMTGEIESILHSTGAKLLETVCGVPFYEIEEGIIAYAGGVGKVNAAMSTQLFIDLIFTFFTKYFNIKINSIKND